MKRILETKILKRMQLSQCLVQWRFFAEPSRINTRVSRLFNVSQ